MRELQSDLSQHVIQVIQNVIVPKAQHPTSLSFKISAAPRVIGTMVKVLTTIQFDHQFYGRRIKIDNIGSKRVLTTKRHALETVCPNTSP